MNEIIWLEDSPEQDIKTHLKKACESIGFKLVCAENINLLADHLLTCKTNNIKGFIIDRMLSGPSNLGNFVALVEKLSIDNNNIKKELIEKLTNKEWQHDLEDGGLIIIEYILKSNDFPDYQNIPLLILSVRSQTTITDYDYILKRSFDDSNWMEQVTQWVKKLA